MRISRSLFLGAVLLISSVTAVFAQSPFQLALFNPVQIISESQDIGGIRIDLIYGKNTSVGGLDIGLVNHTTSGISKGIEWGLVGYNEGSFTGWQWNAVSITRGTFTGLQMGWYTTANHCGGVQIGIVNHSGTMKGIQLGLLNFIDQGGFLPIFPIVNWSL